MLFFANAFYKLLIKKSDITIFYLYDGDDIVLTTQSKDGGVFLLHKLFNNIRVQFHGN